MGSEDANGTIVKALEFASPFSKLSRDRGLVCNLVVREGYASLERSIVETPTMLTSIDSDSNLEQLTSNALSAPGAIVSRHLHD